MNVDELRNRLIDIAQSDPLGHETAISQLVIECKDAQFPQTKASLRAGLKSVVEAAGNIAAAPVVNTINEEWFIIGGEGSTRFARWEEAGLCMYRKADFATLVAPLTREAQGLKPEEVYIQSKDRKLYTGVTIDASAGPVVGDKINLWQGYGVEPREGDVSPFLSYMKTVFPNEWEYILKWCAFVVQNPDKRANVALFLISRDEGTGKSTLGWIIRRIFGTRHAVKVSKSSDLTGQFNAHLASALFIHGDEILFRGAKQAADQLKTVITDDRLRVEPKGLASFEKDNHISMLLTSNHEHAAHIGPSDRRYAFAEAADTLTGNKPYWDKFYGWLKSGGVEMIANTLLEMDVSNFDARGDRPFSDLYLINKRGSLKQVAKWWRDCIDAERLLGMAFGDEMGGWHAKKHIFMAYVTWQNDQRDSDDAVESRLFWKDMNAFGAITERRKRHGVEREVQLVDWEEANRRLFAKLS